MHRSVSLTTCGLVLSCAVAGAQSLEDFARLKVKPGDTVYVLDEQTGVEVTGPVRSVTPAELKVEGYSFKPMDGLKIERRGDPIWDGALLGGGARGARRHHSRCGGMPPRSDLEVRGRKCIDDRRDRRVHRLAPQGAEDDL